SMMYMPEDMKVRSTISVRTLFKDTLDLAEAAQILNRLERCDAPMRMAQIRVLGGAAARIPAACTAYAHRDAGMIVGFLAMDGNAEAAARHDRWASVCVMALGGAERGTHVNFLAEQGDEMLRASYPGEIWRRLRQVKHIYDPDNLFHRNHNIPPA